MVALSEGRNVPTNLEEKGVAPVHLQDEQSTQFPPIDRGKDAWLFLAACFFMEALVWGFAFTYGVFQAHYSSLDMFKDSRNIAVIGTCAMGIMYLDLPIVFVVFKRWPNYQRTGCAIGVLMMCLAMALSSFATNVTHLIVSQGVFYALGGSIAYSPCILLMEDWFDKRKGLAFGVMWAGTGLGGVILPLVMQSLLDRFGFRVALRAFAVALFVLTAPLVYFVKPRVPVSERPISVPIKFHFMFTSTFALFEIFNVIQALGFFLPSIYLPSYAHAIGAPGSMDALTVILVNVASVVGCVAMGAVVDKWDSTKCILLSTVGSTLGVFFLWGFSSSLEPLFVFAVVYGFFAGSYTSTWPGIMRDVGEKRSADSTLVLSCLSAGRGIGNIASGPLSEVLLRGMPWKGQASYGFGSGYGTLIVFTGVTGLLGGGSFLARRFKWM
ncbi:hypothetical protein ACJ72_06829 [Emergomyces africanus]|uniref:Major facilitator superfamily (MFS) profile domain-containing protein n=1 Tax=Emergomyces africanus TaxID=1955775 RepID=A0A1B7NPZ2_9EURO|nr:hypothetical protein ACJ72_06829 [Emergomyces africanus]